MAHKSIKKQHKHTEKGTNFGILNLIYCHSQLTNSLICIRNSPFCALMMLIILKHSVLSAWLCPVCLTIPFVYMFHKSAKLSSELRETKNTHFQRRSSGGDRGEGGGRRRRRRRTTVFLVELNLKKIYMLWCC